MRGDPRDPEVTISRAELSELLVQAASIGLSAPRDICTTRGELARYLRSYPGFRHYVTDPNE